MSSAEALQILISRFGIETPSVEARRLLHYLALLEKWNVRVNLTASTEWSTIGFLFEEALWAARFFPEAGGIHLDIGSGAGFPAIPMRILRPAMRLRLLESRAKRAAFLETAAAELPLPGTEVICRRAEEYLAIKPVPKFDSVSWKGLKLSAEALSLLLAASRPTTLFWIFHGAELPVEDAGQVRSALRLVRHERFPGRASWQLSIFGTREESFT